MPRRNSLGVFGCPILAPAAGARVGSLFSVQRKLRANISQASTNRRVFGCPILVPAAGARVGFRLLRIVVGARHAVPLRAERCNRRRIERNPHLAAAPAPRVRFLFHVAPAFRPAPASLPQGTPPGRESEESLLAVIPNQVRNLSERFLARHGGLEMVTENLRGAIRRLPAVRARHQACCKSRYFNLSSPHN